MLKKIPPSLALVFIFLFPEQSWSDARRDRFRKSSKATQFIAGGINYKSDHNSKERDLAITYQFKNDRNLSEIDLRHRTIYSSTSTTNLQKTQNLYDAELSFKNLIGDSNFYSNLFNRSKYDELSTYYYDITTAGGIGRVFFDKAVYFDLNLGWQDVKNANSEAIINPSLRVNFNLTKNLSLTQIGYLIIRQQNSDEQLKTRLSYRIMQNIHLQLYHTYDKERYIYKTSKINDRRTEVSRSYVFRIRYDF